MPLPHPEPAPPRFARDDGHRCIEWSWPEAGRGARLRIELSRPGGRLLFFAVSDSFDFCAGEARRAEQELVSFEHGCDARLLRRLDRAARALDASVHPLSPAATIPDDCRDAAALLLTQARRICAPQAPHPAHVAVLTRLWALAGAEATPNSIRLRPRLPHETVGEFAAQAARDGRIRVPARPAFLAAAAALAGAGGLDGWDYPPRPVLLRPVTPMRAQVKIAGALGLSAHERLDCATATADAATQLGLAGGDLKVFRRGLRALVAGADELEG